MNIEVNFVGYLYIPAYIDVSHVKALSKDYMAQ
jgi:hypothetical protein